jgi:hypothetical protein
MRLRSDMPRGLTIVPQPGALTDLVSSLHEHCCEVDQTEQGEQVHNIVENEHLMPLSVLDVSSMHGTSQEEIPPWVTPGGVDHAAGNGAVVRPFPPSSRTTTTSLGNRIDLGHELGKTRDPGRSGRYRRDMRNDDTSSERMAGFDPTLSPSQFRDAVLYCPRGILIPRPRSVPPEPPAI